MACLKSLFTSFKLPCTWSCCEIDDNKINTSVFWENFNKRFYKFKQNEFFNAKKINISDNCSITLAVLPEKQFKIIACLEDPWGNSILLHHEDLLNFINCVGEQFEANEIYPIDDQHQRSVTYNKYIKIIPIQEKLFNIKVGKNHVKLGEDALHKLNKQIPVVKSFIRLLEVEREKYETYLLKLLYHFCQNKNVDESLKLSTTIYTQHFFEECINFHCNCIDNVFVMEIALNFSDWFVECIHPFMKTIMINECMRLNSFSHDWPHDQNVVDIKTMAKSGLYFTGVLDCVECAFCSIKLHTWEIGDDPIKNHHNYSKYCPLLINPLITSNVVIDGNEKKLIKLLEVLPTYNLGYDEVDI